jgi:hypothetical protein
MTAFPALAARIDQEVIDLRRSVERAAALMAKATDRGDADYLDGVALNLHAFYTGVEHILEAIAREVDESLPGGPEWHRDLLLQMSGSLADVRPPVLSHATRECLEAYRGFRHVVRNVYTYNLDANRVRQLATELPDCCAKVAADLEAFTSFLAAIR